MKIVTYNVNGIRSALSKGFENFLSHVNPDIVCLQEIKATPEQVDTSIFKSLGYNDYWYPAQKKGYSGVAIFSKEKPKNIEYGCGNELFDFEGRVIRADFDNYSVMSVYFPSGTTGDERQNVKYKFLDFFFDYAQSLRKKIPNLIIGGDYNICHKPIDIHDPISNKNSSGFLPEEREWMDKWFSNGFTDAFRALNTEPHQYSWWSFRAGARARNKGWRIDYISVSNVLEKNITSTCLLPDQLHSDHCSMVLELKI